MPGRINVVGLRELRNELRAIDGRMQRELQKANKRAAADVIVPAARHLAEGRHNPKWGHEAIGTIRALATQTRAQVALGSAKVTWAAGHEFGSIKYKQFPPSIGYKAGGYALYAAIDQEQEQLVGVYGDLLQELADSLG